MTTGAINTCTMSDARSLRPRACASAIAQRITVGGGVAPSRKISPSTEMGPGTPGGPDGVDGPAYAGIAGDDGGGGAASCRDGGAGSRFYRLATATAIAPITRIGRNHMAHRPPRHEGTCSAISRSSCDELRLRAYADKTVL